MKAHIVDIDKPALWDNNLIQFARLISELEMAGALTKRIILDLQASMDLGEADLIELLDRAQDVWDESVANLNNNKETP